MTMQRIHKHIFIVGILGSMLLLSSCALFQNHTGPVTQQQECLQMKRQIAYNRNNPNIEAAWSAPSERLAMKQRYEALDCGKVADSQ